jgi:transglutaminase-like putative cysteine protease
VRYVARAPFVAAAEFALPSPYVPRLPALRELGAGLFTPGRPVAEAVLALMHRLHAEFSYESRSTEVDTPLQQVLLQRRGVCQDFAHLLAGVLRAWGLPARYVSGYLLTHAPAAAGPGEAHAGTAMLGADASHAWVQVWCPGTPGVPAGPGGADDAWLDLDPTNDCVPGSGHVRVAVGRDFGDVTPLRGVIRGGGHHTLAVGVTTRRLDRFGHAQQAHALLSPTPMENTGS